jgi:hypothetical protein
VSLDKTNSELAEKLLAEKLLSDSVLLSVSEILDFVECPPRHSPRTHFTDRCAYMLPYAAFYRPGLDGSATGALLLNRYYKPLGISSVFIDYESVPDEFFLDSFAMERIIPRRIIKNGKITYRTALGPESLDQSCVLDDMGFAYTSGFSSKQDSYYRTYRREILLELDQAFETLKVRVPTFQEIKNNA